MCCATVLLMAGCTNLPYFEEFVSKEKESWNMNDPVGFQVQIGDAEAAYDLIFTFRNTTDYSYSNLYVFLTTIHPDQTARRDTLEFLLADRYGRWLGKGMGKIRESSFLVRQGFYFPDTGNFVFILEQAMRDQTLQGIADVGIRIEKSETMK